MPKTLLLADDSVTIQKVVGISFANEDIELVTVDNGTDAVARAREVKPDIILADVVMPGLSGYEVCEAIKGDPELSSTPVLLLTGTFEAFDEARATQAGADGHITKPFEAQALVDCVNARLAAGSSAPAPPAAQEAAADSASDEAYNFLEDEITEPPEEPLAGEATTVLVTGESFSFDAPEDVHKELTLPPSGAPTPPEPQVTVHDEPLLVSNPDFSGDETALIEEAAPEEAEAPLFEEAEPSAEPAAAATSILAWEETPPLDTGDDSLTELLEPAVPGDLGALDAADPLLADPLVAGDSLRSAEPLVADESLGGEDPLASDDPLAAVGPEDLAAESVLDPAGGRDYDVSSSDLGEPLAEIMAPTLSEPGPGEAGGDAAATNALSAGEPVSLEEIAPELPETGSEEPLVGEPIRSPDLPVAEVSEALATPVGEVLAATGSQPLVSAGSEAVSPFDDEDLAAPVGEFPLSDAAAEDGFTSLARPVRESTAEAEEVPLAEPVGELAPEPETSIQLAPTPSEPPLSAPEATPLASLADSEQADLDVRPDLMADSRPDLMADSRPDLEADSSADLLAESNPELSPEGGPDLTPVVQQQLHDALERIAWEAFSDISERIVNDALERIEKVAWEVIPQMTEALIREEIRKLKEQE